NLPIKKFDNKLFRNFDIFACDHGIVIEFKTMDIEKEATLEISCQEALKHIHEKEYIAKLLYLDIAESNIYVYGFAFQGQKVLIMGGANNSIDWKNILKPKKSKIVKKKK
ncbi:MAG: hypothetical protein IJU40_01745, partial [Desulfovibrionaceae bacterium]|nr:hypothetical protein [Desulfovibrionaceae bacterium]